MTTKKLKSQCENYQRIEQAIGFLANNFQDQPNLEEIAANVNLSKYYFQRLFKRWAGVTPTQFLHYLTLEYAKECLLESRNILDTTLKAGLSSSSRLYDLFITFDAMTPGEYKNKGMGLDVNYGFHPTPFGECLLATTKRGICALHFVSPNKREVVFTELQKEWEKGNLIPAPDITQPVVQNLFTPLQTKQNREFHLVLKGTNFQVKVWQFLLSIPSGAMVTYQDVATYVSTPAAARAVGNAISKNPIAYLIPCHRVIAKVGEDFHYRWGSARKKAILGWEASRKVIQS
jgi:AraC family transcriptional regulator of adaptative response/methylated-DNA-[protein]-cysteine methyltransferase